MNTYTNPYRTYSNEAELDHYIALCGAAEELLEQLTEWVSNHGDVSPDDVTQIHVNRMSAVVDRLAAIKRFAVGV